MNEWVVGIDAGGTRVRVAVAERATGEIVWTDSAAACADGGPEAALSLIPVSVRASVIFATAGIAKFTRADVAPRWEAALTGALTRATVTVLPDYAIAYTGSLGEAPGAVVITGTGSVVYAEDGKGGSVRVGGRGWEYGDEGSGAHLTADALRRTLRAADGMTASSALTHAVSAFLGTIEPGALAEAARQRAERDGRGFLVPLILTLSEQGDREAEDLFVGAAGWLAALAATALERLALAQSEVLVCPVGGLWNAGERLLTPFERVLARRVPKARVVPAAGDPLAGAVRRALTTP